MRAYAVPSEKGFVTSKPLVRKRKRGRVDEGIEFFRDADIVVDENGEMMLIKDGKIVGVFEDEEETE